MAAAGSKLEERAPEDGIYQGADDEGRLSFAENLKVPDVKWAYHSLHPGQVVALALTEVCCGMGIGKVRRAVNDCKCCMLTLEDILVSSAPVTRISKADFEEKRWNI